MPKEFIVAATVAAVIVAGSTRPSATAASGQAPRDADPQDCGRYHNQFGDDQEVARAEEQVDVSSGEADRITARTRNGGILVVGWDRDVYRVKACKAAAGNTLREAQVRLQAMALRVEQGLVSVSEPPEGRSIVHYIVLAPSGGAVDLRAANGPLSLRDFSGTAQLESQNGPISIVRSSGQIVAQAVNGPVTVTGSSGDITARTQNGPLGISLTEGFWQGEKLEASTRNGPVRVDVPDDYQSGVEVRMGRHSPYRCATAACGESANRTWDQSGRRVVMGSSDLLVKLSTQNGPVTIGSIRHRD